MDYLIKIFKQKNIKQVCARYIQTRKNELVANFYDNSSFYSETTTESEKTYVMDTYKYKPNLINYIEVNDGRQN
jgi:predicted enzyme involved in methoxymalonyl-ACP biosynthesis